MNWYLKCLKQYADFSGRARRKEYWMFALFNIIISFALGFIESACGLTWTIGIYPIGIISTIYALGLFIPGLAVCVRRLHDIGKSGWNYLWILIPIVGCILLLVWFCKAGDQGVNGWGEDPKAGENGQA